VALFRIGRQKRKETIKTCDDCKYFENCFNSNFIILRGDGVCHRFPGINEVYRKSWCPQFKKKKEVNH
jgi:hypothetical protein